jgi:hypothetical protein
MKTLLLLLMILMPACANAGRLDLAQDLRGLDLSVTLVPSEHPDTIIVENKTAKIVTCSGSFVGPEPEQRRPSRSSPESPARSAYPAPTPSRALANSNARQNGRAKD